MHQPHPGDEAVSGVMKRECYRSIDSDARDEGGEYEGDCSVVTLHNKDFKTVNRIDSNTKLLDVSTNNDNETTFEPHKTSEMICDIHLPLYPISDGVKCPDFPPFYPHVPTRPVYPLLEEEFSGVGVQEEVAAHLQG